MQASELMIVEYTPLATIGVSEGMNGQVFEAIDPQTHRRVAVKVISKAKLSDEGVTEYFAEARLMHAARHPHVAPIYSAGTSADGLSVVIMMPYYARGTLARRIESGPLQLRAALEIAHGLLQGLAQIHTQGFLHLDLKPSNVLFDNVGKPLVADFGQARMLGPQGLAATPRMYQFAVPPEAWNWGAVDTRADTFQAGLTLYRMVNGEPFFQQNLQRQVAKWQDNTEAMIRAGGIIDANLFMPHVPQLLRTIIRRAISKEPTDRYATATDLQDAIGRVDFKHNWCIRPTPTGHTWISDKRGKAPIIIESVEATTNRHTVMAHRITAGNQKVALRRVDFWAADLSPRNLVKHLQKVFRNLG